MFEYLARAKVEFGVGGITQPYLDPDLDVDIQRTLDLILKDNGDVPEGKEKHETEISEEFPVKFGPFTIDKSPIMRESIISSFQVRLAS